MDKQDSFYVMFKHAFEKLGLTHQEVSKEFSVSHVTIDRWLENKGKPHPYMQIPLIAWLHNKLKDIMVFKKYGCPSKQINTCEGCSEIECLENLKEQGFCLVCGEKVCGAHIPDAKNDIDESIQVRIRYLKDEKNDICDALEQHVEPAFRKKLNEELREVQVKLRQLHKDETKELNQEKLKPLSHGEAI
jgi:transcriptional regulator with XRE-family HTH domain